jgi:putative solute:sodium symporter small subunit
VSDFDPNAHSMSEPEPNSSSDSTPSESQPADAERVEPLTPETHPNQKQIRAVLDRYWKKNIRIMMILLAIWAFVSLGCGIVFSSILNYISIGGFPLGFWFAQQGSIFIFVLLILIYCVLLNRMDRKHHQELEVLKTTREGDFQS